MKEPLEIIIKDDIQNIIDSFCACFNIRIIFYSSQGEILKTGLNKSDSLFCRLLQKKLYGKSKCLVMDEQKRIKAVTKRALICYRCHAGLVEVINPVFIENHLIGFTMIGQFRATKRVSLALKKEWSSKYDLSRLQKAFYQLPYFSPEKINHIVDLFSILADYIISKEMVAIRGDLFIDKIISYIRNNVTKNNISLDEVAAYVGRSPSTISHSFKEHLGISFKKMCIEAKLDKAEEYMRTISNITVGEVSEKLGYDDQFYFSRIYKKFRKIPPSRYIRNYTSQK